MGYIGEARLGNLRFRRAPPHPDYYALWASRYGLTAHRQGLQGLNALTTRAYGVPEADVPLSFREHAAREGYADEADFGRLGFSLTSFLKKPAVTGALGLGVGLIAGSYLPGISTGISSAISGLGKFAGGSWNVIADVGKTAWQWATTPKQPEMPAPAPLPSPAPAPPPPPPPPPPPAPVPQVQPQVQPQQPGYYPAQPIAMPAIAPSPYLAPPAPPPAPVYQAMPEYYAAAPAAEKPEGMSTAMIVALAALGLGAVVLLTRPGEGSRAHAG
jgi:hypothetical protein